MPIPRLSARLSGSVAVAASGTVAVPGKGILPPKKSREKLGCMTISLTRCRPGCPGAAEIAMGAGRVAKGKAYGGSETELFAGVCGPAPTEVVIIWAGAEKLLHIT